MCRDLRTPAPLSMANGTMRGVPGRMVGAGARWSCDTYREDRAAGEGGNPVAEHGGEVRGVCLYQRW